MLNLSNTISLFSHITATNYKTDYIFYNQALTYRLPCLLNFIKQLPIIESASIQLINTKNYKLLHCNNLILANQSTHFPVFVIMAVPDYYLYPYTANKKQSINRSEDYRQQQEIMKQFNQAIDYQQTGQLAAAISIYQQILVISPNHSHTLHYYGLALCDSGDNEQGIALIKKALEINPHYAEAYTNLGYIYDEQGQVAQAIGCYKKAIEINPKNSDAYCNLGGIYQAANNLAEAIDCYKHALSINPNHSYTHYNLGLVYNHENKFSLAEKSFQAALAIQPNHINACINLGLLYTKQNRTHEAINYYQQALAIDANNAQAHFNLATAKLLLGDFLTGFAEFEWRWQVRAAIEPKKIIANAQEWRGQSLINKTLLLYFEQGAGDAIQYSRYLSFIADNYGGSLIFQCPQVLISLFSTIPQITKLINTEQPLPAVDYYLSLLSLPWVLKTRLETIPHKIPYLWANKKLTIPLAIDKTKLNIGFVWAGNPAHANNQNRSVNIRYFSTLTAIEHTQFYSLQLGNEATQLTELRGANPIINLGCYISEFADTAAMISQLDLIICVDTAVAHLAGALNKSAWILLPFAPDFRWLLEREDSPWYPSVRLFRQTETGNWQTVFENLKAALLKELAITGKTGTTENNPQPLTTIDINTALHYHHNGQPDQAKLAYQQLLKHEPNNEVALHYLGLLAHQEGNTEHAIELLKKSLAIKSNDAIVHNNLGIIYMEKNQFTEAIFCYDKALEIEPNYPVAHYNKGYVYQKQQLFSQAIACYESAIALNPNYTEAYHNLGLVYQNNNELEQAINYCKKALDSNANYIQAYNVLGDIYLAKNELDLASFNYKQALNINPECADAIVQLAIISEKQNRGSQATVYYKRATEYYQKSLQDNPKTPEAYYQLGNLYVKQHNYSQAQFCYEKELAINPQHIEAHCHLGVVYANQKQLDKAIESFRKALSINENHVNALCNLGNTYIDKNDLPLALIYLEKAFSLDDQHVDTLNNLGLLHKNKNKLSEAIACYKKAIAIDCYYANAHFNLAFVSLLSGDYELGWQEYEWRFQANKQLTPEQQFPNCKQWQGEKLTHKTLLIYTEQGFGDAIQFIRYVILVAQSVDNIIVQCLTPLHRLFNSIPQISQLVGFDQPLPHFDVYFPLMSLPRLFNTRAKTIPATIPYLQAPKSANFPFSVHKNTLNVGLVWVGNPAFKNDKKRSIDISNFQSITLLKQVQFYSLQVGDRRSDLSQITFANPVIEIGDKVKDFADTAAIIEQLDLVISVDTSVAHLAGALNKPVWILLPFSPDFRWLLAREDCPWYPSAHLFRQREAGLWHDVFNRIKQTLENEILIHFSKVNATIDTPLIIKTETIIPTDFDISIASDNAFKYHQAGQLEQAKQLYQQILAIDENNIDILHYLGLVLHQLGETEQGISFIKKAIAINPEYIMTYNNLGIIYMEKNQLDEAIDCYQQVIALNSNYAPAYYNMGSAYQRKKNLTQAMTCYQQALSLNPNYAEAHYNLGVIYQETDVDTAISCYKTVLSIQPNYAQAHYNLGTIYLKQQNYEQAISHYQAALLILPDYVEAQCYLGHAYLKQKDFTNAITHYEKTLVMQADYVDAICGLGSVYLGQNQLELAIEYYEKTLAIQPNYTEAQSNLGLVYIQQNKIDLASACYQKALQIDNNYIDAYCGLGDIYLEQNQFELAIEYYEKALIISPNHLKTQCSLGRVYFKQKALESALICYQKALQTDKNNTVGLSGLGSVYLEQSQFELAIECYKKSLAVDENQAYPLCCLGFIYLKLDQLELAIEYYEKAVAIEPDDKKSYLQLGFLFYIVANPVQAIFYYKKAIALDADYADAHMNMAFAQLLNGDYEQGWQEHEWRWQVGELNFPKMMFAIEKKWQGEHLAGKTILLYAEQGLGDVIQFIRYVSLIADYGAAIIVRCQPTLKSLFVGLPNVKQIITDKENFPYFDFHSSLMSLPWVFNTRLQTIPAQVPYLFVNKKTQLNFPFNENTLNIGFVWAGNSQHLNNKNRSIAITHFQVFSQIKAVQFYSLQVGDSNKDLNQLQFINPIIDVGSQVNDFAETAVIMNKLDLIICVDTSVAHLAGALNKPTWLLLPFAPDWRWLLAREDSPWYPSFRLFRQTQRGDWSPVFQRLKYELEQLVDK